jgi:hypothetical protein
VVLAADIKMNIPKIERPQNSNMIKIANPYEVNWWCIEFGTTPHRLIEAVNKVGVATASVRYYLLKKSATTETTLSSSVD